MRGFSRLSVIKPVLLCLRRLGICKDIRGYLAESIIHVIYQSEYGDTAMMSITGDWKDMVYTLRFFIIDTCPICRDSLQFTHSGDSVVVMLMCHHLFHTTCIKKWSEKRESCPLCNRELCTRYHYSGVISHKRRERYDAKIIEKEQTFLKSDNYIEQVLKEGKNIHIYDPHLTVEEIASRVVSKNQFILPENIARISSIIRKHLWK